MPTLAITETGANGQAHDYSDVETIVTQMKTWANVTKLDYDNLQDSGIRPVKIRAHAGVLGVGIKIRNASGTAFVANDMAYFSGTYNDGTDDYPACTLADAHATHASNFAAAIVIDAAVADGADGTGYYFKEISGVDTSGATVGDPVYLSTTAGRWTLTRGTADEFVQVVGIVTVVHASTGRIVLSPGWQQDEYLFGAAGGLGIWLDLDKDSGIHATADDTIKLKVGGTDELILTATGLTPNANDGLALGSTTLGWADFHLATGSVINWVNGDVTLTHAAGKLTYGGDGAVEIDFNNHEMTNVDINSGAIDGTAIGAASVAAGSFAALVGTTITGSGVLSIDDTTESTSTTTGSIHTDGGLGVVGDIYAGDDIFFTSGAVLNFNGGAETITHSANTFTFAGASSGYVFNNGNMYINETSNSLMTQGFTINQGANDDEILDFKSSDVAHGITNSAETDTFGLFKKWSGANGGLRMEGLADGTSASAIAILSTSTGEDTTKTTSGVGGLYLDGRKANGVNTQALGADANIVVIRTNGTTRFIFDVEGSAHADVEWVAYAKENDFQLIKDIEATLVPEMFGEAVQYKESDLERLGLFGKGSIRKEPNGKMRGMMNSTRMLMLHHGTLNKVVDAFNLYETRINQLESQVQKLLSA